MKIIFKYLFISTFLVTFLASCKTAEVIQNENETYTIKVWGNLSKSEQDLRNKLAQEAVKICGSNGYEYVGNPIFTTKAGPGKSLGPGEAGNSQYSTKILRRTIRCH